MPYLDVLANMGGTLGSANDQQFSIDLEEIRQVGVGTPLQVRIVVEVRAVVADANTMTITLETAENEALSTNEVVLATPVSAAQCPDVGTVILVPIPPQGLKRWLGIRFKGSSANAFSAGRIQAFVEPHLG